MKKEIELAIRIVENSTQHDLGQIEYAIDGKTIKVYAKDSAIFSATSLIGVLSSISNLYCYIDYDKNLQKIVLVVF